MERSYSPVLVLSLCIIATMQLYAHATDSTLTTNAERASVEAALYRSFKSLSINETNRHSFDPIVVTDETIADTILQQRMHAHALLQQVLAGQRFLESLDAFSEIDLPVGIVKSGGALDYAVLIDRIQITKEGAVMDVYMSLALPQTGARLAFHGAIPLSAQGGVAGNARIYLLGDHRMALSNSTLLTVRGTPETYVEFDCSGFLGINLAGELQFSTDVLLPENEEGKTLDERLRASFTTYTSTLNDILTSITIPPFQVRGLSGFGFSVQDAYVDWSDLVNPPGISFPTDYTSSFLRAGLDSLWQGIYLRDIQVRLPSSFTRKGTKERIAIGARQMILDDQGLTGDVYVESVFSDGDMNGWAYSLDVMSIQLVTNQVKGFSLQGRLSIPVVKDKKGNETEFIYTAQRSAEGNYVFSVSVENELKLDLWLADIRLSQGSSVIVAEKDNRFYPSAHLNGELSINITSKGPKASFNSLRFENMVISSEAPYFQPGTFGFGREGHNSSVLKYPVVFDNIAVKSEDHRVGLAFDLLINITGSPEDESFAGKGGLIVWGIEDGDPKRNSDGKVIALDRKSWVFDEVELTKVRIEIKKPKVIELVGEVRFFDDDAIYGEGFKGSLKGSIHKIKVEAQALFGRTETFRYWYADALVELKTGIPIVPGVLSAFGFGGGYYSKMKQATGPVDGTLGRSPSGITYVPDENALGVRAVVLIGTPRPEALRGDVALEVSLNRHGGINSITFTGNANFMSVGETGSKQIRELAAAAVAGKLTEKLNSLTRGQVFGSVTLHFDFANDIFHGNLEIYVNVAGGMVRGVSDGNKAGWAVMHFEQNDWYIHIGTPDQPLGLEVARIFKAKSYFMLGKNLPGSPPPPQQVSEILGNIDLDYMRDLNALESGMGIAFGLHFLVDTGDLRFLMFYGRFSAGTGLDFMLKDYGNEYHCAGMSGPMGINGWYANGQAYAFVMGKIGIKVNLRFYKGKYEILNIGAAAILQAKGPNPFWMRGTVGGYYRILGGLVKGRCRFDLTVGTECKPVKEENLLEEVTMIAGITPAASSTDVSVFNAPQVAFNIPIGEVFEIRDLEGKTHFFRAVLDQFEVMNASQPLAGKLVWNAQRDVVAFDASDLLPGEVRLTARARLSFEEKSNGAWSKVKFDGKIVSETAESEFQTGKAPDFLPENNIAFAYPVPNQLNFYPGEYAQGFIQLQDGQPYLFAPGNSWTQVVRMTEAESGQSLEVGLSYNTRTRRVTFPIPDGFQESSFYQFEIINKPRQVAPIDANAHRIDRELSEEMPAGAAVLTTQSLDGDLELLETKAIFSTSFRTSQYHTFIDKMAHTDFSRVIRLSSGINIFQLAATPRGDERFDEAEAGSDPNRFVHPEAILEDNRWYQSYVHPLVYDGYPLLGWMKVKRPDAHLLGVPPIRDILFKNIKTARGDFHSAAGPFTDELLIYNLGQSVASDFYDMQRHAVNYIADHPAQITPRLEALALQPLPYLRYGAYRLRFNYVIPGIERTTSSYEIEILNHTPDND